METRQQAGKGIEWGNVIISIGRLSPTVLSTLV